MHGTIAYRRVKLTLLVVGLQEGKIELRKKGKLNDSRRTPLDSFRSFENSQPSKFPQHCTEDPNHEHEPLLKPGKYEYPPFLLGNRTNVRAMDLESNAKRGRFRISDLPKAK
jgi:hypothetical protein